MCTFSSVVLREPGVSSDCTRNTRLPFLDMNFQLEYAATVADSLGSQFSETQPTPPVSIWPF